MVRRSQLYAWQLQYGLATDTTSVPSGSEAALGGNTGGNAGGTNPSPPAKGGGISSITAQSTLDEVVDAFEGLSLPTVKSQLTLAGSVRGGGPRTPMPTMAVRRLGDNAITNAIKDYFGTGNPTEVELYSDGNGRNWVYVRVATDSQANNTAIGSGWHRHPGSDRVFWRYVP